MTSRQRRVVEANFRTLEERDLDAFLGLWAPQGTFEMPYAPSGLPRVLRGAAALRMFWGAVLRNVRRVGFTEVRIEALAAPGRFVTRHRGNMELLDGRPYRNAYVAFFEIDDERIVHLTEYFDPVILTQVFGDSEDLARTFG